MSCVQLCALHLSAVSFTQLYRIVHNGVEDTNIQKKTDFWAREFPKTCMFCVNVIHCNTCGANASAWTEQWPKLPKAERTMKVVADCISWLKGATNLSKVIVVPNCGSYMSHCLDILRSTNSICICPVQGISSKFCVCNLDPEMVGERNLIFSLHHLHWVDSRFFAGTIKCTVCSSVFIYLPIILSVWFKGCFNTPLEHTPKPFTNRLWRDSFHSWLGGLPGVCSKGVLQFSWIDCFEL